MNCLVCGNHVSSFSGTKLQNGRLCKECSDKCPSLFLKGNQYLQEFTLKNAMQYIEENRACFCATASYGELHIDELHGLFCIAKSLDKDGKPKQGNNIFSIYNLSEVGLTCTSPRVDHNNVIVDIEFRCTLDNLRLPIAELVKRSVRCHTKRVDSKNVTWDEPNDLIMFKTLFNHMLEGAWQSVNERLCGKLIEDEKLQKAKILFMIEDNDDYTLSDLKRTRRMMMKIYHPDVAEYNVTREAKIINDAYDVLKRDLNERNKANETS